MKEGIYLVNQSNLNDEVLQFMELFRENPHTKSKKSFIVQIKFEVGLIHIKEAKDRKYVIICIDATYGQNFDHCQLKNVSEANGIKYVNENIGSVILSILDKSIKSERKTFTERERIEFINLHKNKCKNCRMYSAEYEIDHIIPLAAGGSNENTNLQLLCIDCHKDKTIQEKLDRTYKSKDIESSVYNTNVITNIIDNKAWNAYQFVVRKTTNMCNIFVRKK
jgi:5-methylcytosine-specific restriction endonuclease McrA